MDGDGELSEEQLRWHAEVRLGLIEELLRAVGLGWPLVEAI